MTACQLSFALFFLRRLGTIAPLAVRLVESAVWLPADIGVFQRHAAALADQLPGRAQQGIDGDVKQFGEQL